jgi:hypothetical protein
MCNPPTFRVTANDEQWVLTASSSCSCCNGRGEVREGHGEWLDCDCAFDNAAPEVLDAIDAGAAYTIEPCPEWCDYRAAMHQAMEKTSGTA